MIRISAGNLGFLRGENQERMNDVTGETKTIITQTKKKEGGRREKGRGRPSAVDSRL